MINKHIVTSVIVFISTAVLVLATILLVLFPSIHATPAQGGKTVLVDYELTLEEMIENGKYDEVSELIIQQNFPFTGRKKQEVVVIELICFEKKMETKDVLKEFAARGLRAATLPELLAFGQAYPKNEEIRTIVALGSVWRQNQYACLIEDWERGLYVGGGAGFKWGAHCQFVAVASE